MEIFISPQPSPTASPISTNHIHHATTQLRRRQLGNAFEALLDLGDVMQDMVDDIAVVGDLPRVNRLFSSIVQCSAYGVYEPVDRVINKLLLLALGRCGRMRDAQVQPGQGGIGWQSSAQSVTNEHLEFYRNVLSYILSHPAGQTSQDRSLELAQQSLHRLCPRINGLSEWTWAEETSAVEELKEDTARPSALQPQPGIKKRSLPRSCKRQAPLPTPPTQSGDVGFAEPMPTMPLERPWKGAAAAFPTPCSRLPSNIPGRSAFGMADVGEAAADATQSLHSTLPQMQESGAGPEKSGAQSQGPWRDLGKPIGHVPAGFKLRPDHPVSSRCCVLSGTCKTLR